MLLSGVKFSTALCQFENESFTQELFIKVCNGCTQNCTLYCWSC